MAWCFPFQYTKRKKAIKQKKKRKTEKMTSTTTSELAAGTHLFKITGYSVLKEVDVGKYISSSTFTVGGHEFYIDMYPTGNEEKNEEYLSIYLVLNSDDKHLPVQFDFVLVDMSGDTVTLGEKVSHSCTFAFKNQYWGFGRFINRSELEASRFLKDDCLLVKCTVQVVKATREETNETAHDQSVLPPFDLHQHLAKLLESGEMADVTFEIDRESFPAHRLILAARSPVFKQLLNQTCENNNTESSVKIENMKAPVFKALLQYVYTEELPDEEANADREGLSGLEFDQQLLVAAHEYEIERLKLLCEERLCNRLSVGTMASIFVLAEKCKCDRLKALCLEFAAMPDNLIALMQTHARISEGMQPQNTPDLPELLTMLGQPSVAE